LTKELGFLIVALIAIIAVTVILAIPTKDEKFATKYNEAIALQNATNSTSYNGVSPDHVFEEIDLEDVKELSEIIKDNKYTYVVYGSENSADLLAQLHTLNTYAEEYEIETIYVLSSIWVEEQEDLQAVESDLIGFENTLFALSDDENGIEDFAFTTYPTLLVFEDGKLVFNSQDAKELTSWAAYLDFTFPKYNNVEE
jgi:hypothetical protein